MNTRIKKIAQFIANPRLLFCIAIAWLITNGWSYILFAVGSYFEIGWMTAVAGAYLAFLWLPVSPEKLVTFGIAIALLRWLFPNDQKTLAVLKRFYQKAKSTIKRKRAQRKSQTKKTGGIPMSKLLIAYFSATGTTAAVAKELAEKLTADLYEIKPAVPYTAEDLNWENMNSRSSVEMNDKSFRPALADTDAPVANYDTILLGFPIWWYVAPTIINSFLESYDFSGKKVILFATSMGSGFGNTADELRVSVGADTPIEEGELLSGENATDQFAAWIAGL